MLMGLGFKKSSYEKLNVLKKIRHLKNNIKGKDPPFSNYLGIVYCKNIQHAKPIQR